MRGSRRPRRILPLALTVTLLLSGAVASAEKKGAPKGWYAMSVIQATGLMTVTHLWSKGDLFRSVSVIQGVPIVTLVNKDTYYTINAMENVALAVERSPAALAGDAARGRPFANELNTLIEQGGEKIRVQSVAGALTNVWRVTDDAGQRTIWALARGPSVPIRVENFDRRSGVTGQIAYVNWLYDIPISDEFFEPWEDLKIRRMSYAQYLKARSRGPVGPSPPLFSELLNGRKRD